MQTIVLADAVQRQALSEGLSSGADVIWITAPQAFLAHPTADAFIDLGYVNDESRKAVLRQLLPKPVVVNSVVDTLAEIDSAFVRINGWPTFLSAPFIEAACYAEETKAVVETIFSLFNKKIEWLPDQPGFVTPRVVSAIVNEAFLALAEGVSSRDEINTAMKLGTAYPYGPFEWAEKIGVQNIVALLQRLREKNPRYVPAEWLVQATSKTI